MKGVVVDENVPLVANGRHGLASADCVSACVEALKRARDQVVVLDDRSLILGKYAKNLSHKGQPGVGDAFFRWLWDNQANRERCLQVPLTVLNDAATDFAEFPADPSLAGFDPDDRVFAAVAKVSPIDSEILNASDTDWWHFREALARNGVEVRFLCPDLMSGSRRVPRV